MLLHSSASEIGWCFASLEFENKLGYLLNYARADSIFLGQARNKCITQKSLSQGEEEARSGGKEETEKEGRNGAEGENPNQIRTKLNA